MEVLKFSADHIVDLSETIRPEQMADLDLMFDDASLGAFMELEQKPGMNYTIVDSGGRVVACGGVYLIWPQRAQAWAMVANDFGRMGLGEIRKVVTFVRRVLDGYPADRIEATVLCGFRAGDRFARACGFEMEAERLRKYDPTGRDVALYARIRE